MLHVHHIYNVTCIISSLVWLLTYLTLAEARQAHSEPPRRVAYGQTILRKKRSAYRSASTSDQNGNYLLVLANTKSNIFDTLLFLTNFHVAKSKKKHRYMPRSHPYIETILSGGFCSENEVIPDQVSDTDGQTSHHTSHQSKQSTASKGALDSLL